MEQRLKVPERMIQNVVMGISLLMLIIFFYSERNGLQTLWNFLKHAVELIPDFVQETIDYFGNVPSEQLVKSLLVGAIFGTVATLLAYLSQHRHASLSALQTSTAALWLGVGTITGAIGAQILLYPTQHCTYAPDTPSAQFRFGLALTAIGAIVFLVPAWTLLQRRQRGMRHKAESTAGYFRGITLPYVFLMPSLVLLSMFLYYPAIQIVTLSTNKRLFPLPQEKFACLENYTDLVNDGIYNNSFSISIWLTIFIVLISLAMSLGIATLASQKIKWIGLYRTLLIWPYAISPVVTGVIFLSLFREGGSGILNYGLSQTLGIQPKWFTDPNLARVVVVGASVWNILGFNVLFYIAGLQNIPVDLLEAAALDGANRVQRFFRITFPLLSPFTFFLLITNITFSFYGIYGVVDLLTQGGPPIGSAGKGATDVLIYKLYEDAFRAGGQAGSGAAQAMILFVMVAVLTIIQFRFVERRVTYGGE